MNAVAVFDRRLGLYARTLTSRCWCLSSGRQLLPMKARIFRYWSLRSNASTLTSRRGHLSSLLQLPIALLFQSIAHLVECIYDSEGILSSAGSLVPQCPYAARIFRVCR